MSAMTHTKASDDREPTSAAALARSLGVSAAAVSYALHGKPGVSDALRSRILAAARERGMPIPQAAAVSVESTVFGLVLADVLNPFYSELAVTVTDAARSFGHEVFISQTADEQASIDQAVSAMIAHNVDAMILTVSQADDASLTRLLRRAHTPFVQLSRRNLGTDADFVGIDDFRAGSDMARHLLDHGYRRLAIIAGSPMSSASRVRAEGYRKALRSAGVALPHFWNITAGLNEADGIRAAEYLLGQSELPEAVICGTDSIALGLISVLHAHGLRVPDDIAVVGFDGLTGARSRLVDLTTVVQPRLEMAQRAMGLVRHRLSDPNAEAQSIYCNYKLYIGRSCGCKSRKE